MHKELKYNIVDWKKIDESMLYSLNIRQTYIISHPYSCKLLCEPETVGYWIPELLLKPITHAISFFSMKGFLGNINIVNILRGGLNFPIEAACAQNDIKVKGVSFLTSERVFLENKIARIESKYRKINTVDNATIIIGDIIASGETLNNAVHYVEEQYVLAQKSLKNIIVFTIGTDNTLKTIETLNCVLKKRWAEFEGILTVFFEGIFTTYSNVGITGLNLPGVDFYANGGLLAPEYRCSLTKNNYIIFEKCTIYDGGARRFEQNDHIHCILSYWNSLMDKSNNICLADFLKEKYGYNCELTFEEWKRKNGYELLPLSNLGTLYKNEQAFFRKFNSISLYQIAEARFISLRTYYSDFL